MDDLQTSTLPQILLFLRNNSLTVSKLQTGLCVKYYSNKSHPKQNWKTVYCFLKNMSLHRTGARGDTKCQNLNSFFYEVNISKTKSFSKNLSDIKVFFRIERILSKTFLKKAIRAQKVHAQLHSFSLFYNNNLIIINKLKKSITIPACLRNKKISYTSLEF